MEEVAGIGGVFFRLSDTDALRPGYARHLGVGGEGPFGRQDLGPRRLSEALTTGAIEAPPLVLGGGILPA